MRNPDLENEANVFAVLLLMPKKILLEELAKAKLSFVDDEPLKKLCKKFGVSVTAFTFRLCLMKRHGV